MDIWSHWHLHLFNLPLILILGPTHKVTLITLFDDPYWVSSCTLFPSFSFSSLFSFAIWHPIAFLLSHLQFNIPWLVLLLRSIYSWRDSISLLPTEKIFQWAKCELLHVIRERTREKERERERERESAFATGCSTCASFLPKREKAKSKSIADDKSASDS